MILTDSWADKSLANVINAIRDIEARGLDNVWMANVFDFDALTTLAIAAQATSRLGLGTAVVPTFPRHPTAMAQQALTAAAASDNRIVLGIGLSHKMVIENMLGLSYDKPARHMREYLSVLMPLLRGEQLRYAGEVYQVDCKVSVPGADAVPTVVAALGPMMLKIAGQLADGTTTWMTGPKTLEEHIIPSISAAAKAVGRNAPMIVAGIPIALCKDVAAARARLDKELEIYGILPSYRAMLDREGAAGPGDVAILGDETALRQQILALRDMGVTDFNAAIVGVEDGARERTLDFLTDLKQQL
jgi:F420-dependent oxidoreductase-like protein